MYFSYNFVTRMSRSTIYTSLVIELALATDHGILAPFTFTFALSVRKQKRLAVRA